MSAKLLLVLTLAFLAIPPLQAGPVLPNVWYQFGFTEVGLSATGCYPADPDSLPCGPSAGTPTVFADASPWIFTSADPVLFTITDAYFSGDAFHVLNYGLTVGLTPFVSTGAFCGGDPLNCLANLAISSASFLLPAGDHHITIVPYSSPFPEGGTGYFMWQSAVPEPSTWILIGSGLIAAGLLRRRR